jgi:hypothetical protein
MLQKYAPEAAQVALAFPDDKSHRRFGERSDLSILIDEIHRDFESFERFAYGLSSQPTCWPASHTR